MSTFLEILFNYQLAGNISALTAIVGDRIYPVHADQSVTTPYCVCTQVSSIRDIHHGGASDWAETRVQYDFYSPVFYQVTDAAQAVRHAFEGQSFEIAPGYRIAYCQVETEFDDYDPDERIYRRTFDLIFKHIN